MSNKINKRGWEKAVEECTSREEIKIDNILVEEFTYALLTKTVSRVELVEAILSCHSSKEVRRKIKKLTGREVEVYHDIKARGGNNTLFFPKGDDCILNGYTLENRVYRLKNVVEILDAEKRWELHDLFNDGNRTTPPFSWCSHNILVYTAQKTLTVMQNEYPYKDIKINCANPKYELKV